VALENDADLAAAGARERLAPGSILQGPALGPSHRTWPLLTLTAIPHQGWSIGWSLPHRPMGLVEQHHLARVDGRDRRARTLAASFPLRHHNDKGHGNRSTGSGRRAADPFVNLIYLAAGDPLRLKVERRAMGLKGGAAICGF